MGRKPKSSTAAKADNFSPTDMTLATLKKMEERGYRPTKKIQSGTTDIITTLLVVNIEPSTKYWTNGRSWGLWW
ncbi:UvrABC system protein A [Bienertia sinuspersici]